MKIWGIIGLGWLGSKLAQKIPSHWGTRSSDFNFLNDEFPSSYCDVLLLNTPPLLNMAPELFVGKIPWHTDRRIIFISSTSVFGKNQGIITEKDQPIPNSKAGQWLFQVEQLLKDKFQDDLCIIRPGGLIGGERHPIFSLSGKDNIQGGNLSVNLIHRNDLIQIILKVADKKNIPLIHAVSSYHPNKKDYYDRWADQLNLPRAHFVNTQDSRQIDSILLEELNLNWVCPQLDFL